MERSLLFGACGVGVVGWVLSIAIARRERDEPVWKSLPLSFRWALLAFPIGVFLLTLPEGPPFSSGQGLGRGYLLGAIAAFLSALPVLGTRRSECAAAKAAAACAPLWMSLPAVALPLLFMRSSLMDALMGVAMGFVSITVIALQGDNETEGSSSGPVLASGAGFCVALAASCGLGAYRGSEVAESSRWAGAALIMATAVPLSVLVASLPPAILLRTMSKLPGAAAVASRGDHLLATDRKKAVASSALQFIIGAGLMVVCARIVSIRLLDEPRVFYTAVIGVVVGFVTWWLSNDGARLSTEGSANFRLPLSILVALGAAMASFNFALGFGIGIMSLAIWMPLSIAISRAGVTIPPSSNVSGQPSTFPERLTDNLWNVAAFTAALVVYRFMSTRFQSELSGVTLTDHYALFSFLAGATIPALCVGVMAGGRPGCSAAKLLRLVAAGLLALALPAAVLILWKAKATLALLTGAAISAAGLEWSADGGRSGARVLRPLIALALCMMLAQWTPQVLDVATLTRDQKIGLLKWTLGGISALLVAVDLGERWAQMRGVRGSRSNRPRTEPQK